MTRDTLSQQITSTTKYVQLDLVTNQLRATGDKLKTLDGKADSKLKELWDSVPTTNQVPSREEFDRDRFAQEINVPTREEFDTARMTIEANDNQLKTLLGSTITSIVSELHGIKLEIGQ